MSGPPETSALLVVVRHAEAGDRGQWPGDDSLRPLTAKGHRQAARLVAALASFPVARVLSSPYERCVQTVLPLAEARGLPLEETGELAEGGGLSALLELLDHPGGAVACTHGDVLHRLLSHLLDGGLIEPSQAKGAKGSAWVLRADEGQIQDARYLPAP